MADLNSTHILIFVLQVLMYFDYVFTAIFALEVLIKVGNT